MRTRYQRPPLDPGTTPRDHRACLRLSSPIYPRSNIERRVGKYVSYYDRTNFLTVPGPRQIGTVTGNVTSTCSPPSSPPTRPPSVPIVSHDLENDRLENGWIDDGRGGGLTRIKGPNHRANFCQLSVIESGQDDDFTWEERGMFEFISSIVDRRIDVITWKKCNNFFT